MGQLLVNKFAIFIKWQNRFYEVINYFDFPFDKNILIELFSVEKLYSFANFNKLTANVENFFFENEIKVFSPMIYQNVTSGILILGKRFDGMEYTEDNLLFVQSFGHTAILALENFRLV